jgi:hypothetical protein
MQLKTPPKWLRRPCGASFGFGGKLLTFENGDGAAAAVSGGGSGPRPLVHLSRVVTETELVERSGNNADHRVEGLFLWDVANPDPGLFPCPEFFLARYIFFPERILSIDYVPLFSHCSNKQTRMSLFD